MDVSDLPITYRCIIPDDYLDSNGHLNVMWYTHLFGRAVGGLFDLVGMTSQYFRANAVGTFALEHHVRYLKEVRDGQGVTLRTRVLGRSAKRIHLLSFLVIDETEDVAATQEVVSAHVDLRVRRMAPYPTEVAAALDRLIAEHHALPWTPPVCGVMKP